MDYAGLARLYDEWIDYPGYALDRDWPEEEYRLRLARARAEMARAELDALVITSSGVGQWFTSLAEPHEWHDRCQARSAWFIVTHGGVWGTETRSASRGASFVLMDQAAEPVAADDPADGGAALTAGRRGA